MPDDSAASLLAAKYGSGPHWPGLTVQSAPLPRLAWTNANLMPELATVGQSIAPWKRETSIPIALVPACAGGGPATRPSASSDATSRTIRAAPLAFSIG
jgi:hypothetical protein